MKRRGTGRPQSACTSPLHITFKQPLCHAMYSGFCNVDIREDVKVYDEQKVSMTQA